MEDERCDIEDEVIADRLDHVDGSATIILSRYEIPRDPCDP